MIIDFIRQHKKIILVLIFLTTLSLIALITFLVINNNDQIIQKPDEQYIPSTRSDEQIKTNDNEQDNISCDIDYELSKFLKNSSYNILVFKSVESSEELDGYSVMRVIFDDTRTPNTTQTWTVITKKSDCRVIVGPGSNTAKSDLEKLNLPKSVIEKVGHDYGC